MTRYKIVTEGVPAFPNDPRVIAKGATYWNEGEKLRVDHQFDYPYVGWATDIRREGDDITVEIEIVDPEFKNVDPEVFKTLFDFAGFFTDLTIDNSNEEIMLITKARLRAIALVSKPFAKPFANPIPPIKENNNASEPQEEA